jgi:hypothetical protein
MEEAETLPVPFRFEQDDDISVSSDLDKSDCCDRQVHVATPFICKGHWGTPLAVDAAT